MTIWSWLRAAARPTAIVLSLGFGLAACTALPGDGPWMGGAATTTTEALPFDVIDLTPTTIANYRQPPPVDRPSTVSNLSAGSRISVAPGDAIKVRIFEPYEGSIFPTIQRPGADFGVQRVTDDGTINVPFVGTVKVAGLDLNQIEKKIGQQVSASGKAQDPQVIVEFVADRTHTVMVSGDVRQPGRVSLLEGVRTVVEAINKAGGPSGVGGQGGTGVGANQLEVVVRRNGQVILQSQYSDLLAGGDIGLQKNDEIVVRPNARMFTVLGAVVKAGNVDMPKHTISLLEAMGMVAASTTPGRTKPAFMCSEWGICRTIPRPGRAFSDWTFTSRYLSS